VRAQGLAAVPRRCWLPRIGGAGETERPEADGQVNEGEQKHASVHRIASSAGNRIDYWMVRSTASAVLGSDVAMNPIG